MRPARPNRRFQAALAVDIFLGPLLCTLLVALKPLLRRGQPSDAPVKKILVVKMWGLGSLVLASPLFEQIQARYPGARVDFVTLKENQAILDLYPQVERRWLPDLASGIGGFLFQTLNVLRGIRRERYDLLLDLEFFTRFTAILSLLAGARRTHGYHAKGSGRGQLHDVQVPFNVYKHVTANFLALLRGLPLEQVLDFDADAPDVLPAIALPDKAWQRCHETLSADPAWQDERPTVVVNANAGDMALERRWPVEQVVSLIDALAERGDLNLILSGSASDRDYVASLAARLARPDRVVDLSGRVSLHEFIALLQRARVVVTNDSGPLHLAAAAGASTVALFGPETPVLYRPLRSRPEQQHLVHYLGLPCSPCMFVHNNKVIDCWFAKARCMSEIQPRA
ncbi:MAG: glycosyltransferase family 9 protein, partial [Deltaproteobacteria bacterium]|nr:glycosyltransferase family 9 protein [Deltaproteobacteria bacterium]